MPSTNDPEVCLLFLQLITMLGRINMHEVLPHKWIFVHTHDGVQAAVKAMNAMDGGEGGFSIPASYNAATTNLKDVGDLPQGIGRNLSHISESYEIGSSSSASGSGDGSGADLSVDVQVAGGSDSSAYRRHAGQ